jgi:hypothetical protein
MVINVDTMSSDTPDFYLVNTENMPDAPKFRAAILKGSENNRSCEYIDFDINSEKYDELILPAVINRVVYLIEEY